MTLLTRIAAVAASLLLSLAASAQTFPAKPITLIVPWAAGGPTDVCMRALAEATSRYLGQQIIVENRGGAGGTLGAGAMVNAAPDGYTLTQIPISAFRIPHIEKTPYDPIADLTYIVGVSGYMFGVVVRTDSPHKTWADFIAFAKANPDKLSYGTPGANTSLHLTMEEIAAKQGIKWTHVPHKGAAPNVTALLGGHQDATADSPGWAPHVEAGKLRLLVTWGENRAKTYPNVPTLKELGFGIVSNSPYGIAGPKNMDPRIVKILHDAFKKGMEDPSHIAVLEKYNQELWYLNSADYAKYARDTFAAEKITMDRVKPLVK